MKYCAYSGEKSFFNRLSVKTHLTSFQIRGDSNIKKKILGPVSPKLQQTYRCGLQQEINSSPIDFDSFNYSNRTSYLHEDVRGL